MVPRRLRLSRRTFPKTSHGRRFSSPHLTLVTGPATEGGVAAVISKKVARRSVDRHLLKRRLMTLLLPYAGAGQFLVVHARSGSNNLPFRVLTEELEGLMRQIGR